MFCARKAIVETGAVLVFFFPSTLPVLQVCWQDFDYLALNSLFQQPLGLQDEILRHLGTLKVKPIHSLSALLSSVIRQYGSGNGGDRRGKNKSYQNNGRQNAQPHRASVSGAPTAQVSKKNLAQLSATTVPNHPPPTRFAPMGPEYHKEDTEEEEHDGLSSEVDTSERSGHSDHDQHSDACAKSADSGSQAPGTPTQGISAPSLRVWVTLTETHRRMWG